MSEEDDQSTGERGDIEIPTWRLKRYRMAFLIFWGFAVVYALRVNLSVAIVSMVKQPAKNSTHKGECAKNSSSDIYLGYNESVPEYGDETFDWTSEQQGIILGSFFYGYITTQLLGGYLADRFGAKILFGVGVGCTAIFTVITAPIARLGFGWMIALRIIEGIGEGVTFPAVASFWGKWAPPNERSSLAAFSFSGAQFGTIISMPISGYICDKLGWPVMFYIFGGVSCAWVVVWFMYAQNTPQEYKTMTAVELEYINEQLPSTKGEDKTVPWMNIALSIPFWSILITHVCYNWTFYIILTCLPKYLNNVHGFDLSKSGAISSLPYICMFCIIIAQGRLSDYLLRKNIWSRTAVRRVFNTIGLVVPAIALGFISVLDCDTDGVVAMICICCGLSGFVYSGYNTPNHADLSPKFAGSLFGVTNMMGTIPGFLSPQVVGIMTGDTDNLVSSWSAIWYMSMGINLFGGLMYALGASGNEQPWAAGPIPTKGQCSFEIDQLLFRPTEIHYKVPKLEDNPNYEEQSVETISQ